jgi:hypothetical protein
MTPEEIQMMQAMGIPFTFDTTQGKMVRLRGQKCAERDGKSQTW